MEVSKIIYYTRVDGKSVTVPMKDINLREDFFLEDIFYAVKEATDENDLLNRFKRIICDEVEIDADATNHLRFTVTDMHGNVNYIKFKMRKKEN